MPKITKHGGVSDTVNDAGTFAESGGLAETSVEVDEAQAAVDDDYDPGEYTVAEVNTYLDQCVAEGNLDEGRRVLDAERVDAGGKGRAGILNRVI